jgi:hypothetical protein
VPFEKFITLSRKSGLVIISDSCYTFHSFAQSVLVEVFVHIPLSEAKAIVSGNNAGAVKARGFADLPATSTALQHQHGVTTIVIDKH